MTVGGAEEATGLFRPLSVYEGAPEVAIEEPEGGLAVESPPPGAWPTENGSPGQTGRSADPLVTETWRVAWEVPLSEASQPDTILVGGGAVVVGGKTSRGFWTWDGKPRGFVRRALGGAFIDVDGRRMLADDSESGLSTYLLPDGRRDARIMLALPSHHVTRTVLQGPGLLAVLSVADTPFGPRPNAVVEVVRVRDWGEKGTLNIHYGLDPLAGIIREVDGKVRAAAAASGPVLATPGGIRWCDWRLQTLAEVALDVTPRALSVDEGGRAHLLCDRAGDAHLLIALAGGRSPVDVPLPWPVDATFVPPLVGLGGTIFLTPPGQVWALEPDGRLRWSQARAAGTPAGSVAANGLLLASDDLLYAITAAGDRHPLWQPPAPLVTPPVLAGGRIHVASADKLYVLEPA